MSRQWAIPQAHRRPDPSQAIRMKDERTVSGECGIAPRSRLRPVVWRFGRAEIGNVQDSPLLLRLIPQDQFLLPAPGAAFRRSRGAVIENAAIGRPGKCP